MAAVAALAADSTAKGSARSFASVAGVATSLRYVWAGRGLRGGHRASWTASSIAGRWRRAVVLVSVEARAADTLPFGAGICPWTPWFLILGWREQWSNRRMPLSLVREGAIRRVASMEWVVGRNFEEECRDGELRVEVKVAKWTEVGYRNVQVYRRDERAWSTVRNTICTVPE